jgi:hypothetical protein
MNIKKSLLAFLMTSIISSFLMTPSFAEGEGATEPVVEEYVPPAEASEGVGGWAVVNPETGFVHGVIVATIETFNARNGLMPSDYMGCGSGCLLRFQTRATSDGNVAGWHGTQTNIDAEGKASQTNDGSVKWNAAEKNFTISNSGTPNSNGNSVSSKSTLIPEKTALDGKNLHTGIINIENKFESKNGIDKVNVETSQENLESATSVTIKYSNWANHPQLKYDSVNSFIANVEKDVDSELVKQGTDINNGENAVFVSIKLLTTKVKDFVANLFGFNRLKENPEANSSVIPEVGINQ